MVQSSGRSSRLYLQNAKLDLQNSKNSNNFAYSLKLLGEKLVCLLKKLEKCATSSNPNEYAISEIFQSVCLSKNFASCVIRLEIK